MNTTKTIKMVAALAIGVSLAGCNGSNPIADLPLVDAALLLTGASEKASIGLGMKKQLAGDNYRKCMTHSLENKVCKNLYQAMKTEINAEGVKASVANITNKEMFAWVTPQINTLRYLMD